MRIALLACVFTLALVSDPCSAFAQEETEDEITYIDLTVVKVKQENKTIDNEKRKVWVIQVKGSTKQLPVGTRVEFHLRWRRRTLERFTFEIGNSRKFDEKFECLNVDGFAKGLFLRSYIDYSDQTEAVRAEMAKKPAVFWVQSSPWGDTFSAKKFDLGTDKDLVKQDRDVKKFFEDTMLAVVDIDKKVGQARRDAEGKKRFCNGEELDTKKWQSWIEKQAREPLAVIQKKLARYEHSLMFAGHQRDLTAYLTDIVNTVAARTYSRSKNLYKSFGLPKAKEDAYPKLKIGTRKKPTPQFLAKRIRQLCESQEIDPEKIMPGAGD